MLRANPMSHICKRHSSKNKHSSYESGVDQCVMQMASFQMVREHIHMDCLFDPIYSYDRETCHAPMFPSEYHHQNDDQSGPHGHEQGI
jgi:hypothetical protein